MGQEDRQEAGGTHRAARRVDREIPAEDSTDSRHRGTAATDSRLRAGSRTGTVSGRAAMGSPAIISPDSGP